MFILKTGRAALYLATWPQTCLLESPSLPSRYDSPSLLGSIGSGSFRPDVCTHSCASSGAHRLTVPPFGLPRRDDLQCSWSQGQERGLWLFPLLLKTWRKLKSEPEKSLPYSPYLCFFLVWLVFSWACSKIPSSFVVLNDRGKSEAGGGGAVAGTDSSLKSSFRRIRVRTPCFLRPGPLLPHVPSPPSCCLLGARSLARLAEWPDCWRTTRSQLISARSPQHTSSPPGAASLWWLTCSYPLGFLPFLFTSLSPEHWAPGNSDQPTWTPAWVGNPLPTPRSVGSSQGAGADLLEQWAKPTWSREGSLGLVSRVNCGDWRSRFAARRIRLPQAYLWASSEGPHEWAWGSDRWQRSKLQNRVTRV